MRLIDANAYAAEMRKRQDACKEWLATTEDGSEMHIRAEQAMVTFIEASLTLKNQPTIDAIPVEWLETHAREYYEDWGEEPITVENALKMWQREQEAR